MLIRNIGAGLGVAITAAGLVAGVPSLASAQTAPGPEAFTIVVAGSAPQLFVARGTINATGTAIPLSGGNNGGTDVVELPGGSFMLTLVNSPEGVSTMNPVTCVSTFDGSGTSTIDDGTGQFAGIQGSGAFTFHLAFFATRMPQGGCSQQGTVLDVVHDHGSLTLS